MMPQSLTLASSPFWPVAIGFLVSVQATSSGAGRFSLVIPKTAPKSIVPWACGVSGCPMFANLSPAYISSWD